MASVQSEPEGSVRHKIADTTGEIASMIMEEGEWPEMLPFLMLSAKSPTATVRETAMLIFSRLTVSAVMCHRLLLLLGLPSTHLHCAACTRALCNMYDFNVFFILHGRWQFVNNGIAYIAVCDR